MITKEMKIADVMMRFPQTIEVFNAVGLDCHDCQIAEYEEIQHGAGVHDVDVEQLIKDLNRVVDEQQ